MTATSNLAATPPVERWGEPILVDVAGSAGGRLLLGLALFLPTFLVGFDAGAPSTVALSPAATHLSSLIGAPSARPWVLGAYLLAGVASIPVWRALAMGLGRKRAFVTAVVVFLAGSALCGASQSAPQLVAFRVVQGLGAGGVFPLALVVLSQVLPQPARIRATSLLSTAWGVSTLGGPTIGGLLAAHLDWRWLFLGNLPVGAISVFLVARLREHGADRHADRPQTTRPGIQHSHVRLHGACAWTSALAGAALFVIAFVEPVSHGRPVLARLPLAAAWLSWAAGSLLGGRLALRRGHRLPAITGGGLAAAGCVLHILPATAAVAGGAPAMLAGWALLAAGLGMAQVNGILLALATASTTRVRAAAGQHFARMAAGTLALALALAGAGVTLGDAPFLLATAASVAAMLIATRLPRAAIPHAAAAPGPPDSRRKTIPPHPDPPPPGGGS
jgi:predicted MFS family arabinose efflux permease